MKYRVTMWNPNNYEPGYGYEIEANNKFSAAQKTIDKIEQKQIRTRYDRVPVVWSIDKM